MTGRSVPLPIRPRFLSPSLITAAAVYVLCWRHPDAFLYIGEQNVAPRAVSPFEYGPTVLALVLCIGLAPRFDDWERFGSPRVRLLALTNQALAVAAPLLVFFSALFLFYPDDGLPSAGALIPIVSNVVVSALLACICTGVLGPLIGTLLWSAIAYVLMWWQSNAPDYLSLLPYTMSHTSNGDFDSAPRWAWIVVLTLGVATIAYTRRSVPVRITLRHPED